LLAGELLLADYLAVTVESDEMEGRLAQIDTNRGEITFT